MQSALAAARRLTSVPVVYHAGAESVALDGTEGASSQLLLDASDVQTLVRFQNFLFTPEDLVIDAVPIVPEPGHWIGVEIDGSTHKFEVVDLSGEPCFHYDARRLTLFVKTKYVGIIA